MKYLSLSDSVQIKKIEESETQGLFEIEGLYTGYGLTVGNALRRALLSSLPGAAITQIKIKGVGHEFSTIPNVVEDVVEITLNLKKIRLQSFSDEPQVLQLKARGEKEVRASDIETNDQVKIVTPDIIIAHLSAKKAEFDMEITVERGLGYSPAESRKDGKLSIGTIAIDAIFTPVISVNYTIENMRVGDKTDYNRLHLKVVTDGTIKPGDAIFQSASILKDHFAKIIGIGTENSPKTKVIEEVEEAPKKKATKAKK